MTSASNPIQVRADTIERRHGLYLDAGSPDWHSQSKDSRTRQNGQRSATRCGLLHDCLMLAIAEPDFYSMLPHTPAHGPKPPSLPFRLIADYHIGAAGDVFPALSRQKHCLLLLIT